MAEDIGDLEAELLAASRPRVGYTVCAWLDSRDDADEWDRVMLNPRITSVAIATKMQTFGYQHSDDPVQVHRRRNHRGA